MATLGDLLRLGRPHFLLAGVAFVALGIALARHAGAAVDPLDAALAMAAVAFTQWGVHYGNEAHDVDADRANPRRTRLAGGSGLVVAGRVTEGEARLVAACLFGAGAAAAGALAWRAPASLAVSVPLVALSWAYSAPPLRLCARGLGEAATGLIVAVLVPALVLVPAGLGPAATAAWWPLAPLALQVAAAVAVLSLPDADGDAAAGKRTLAVRLGPRRTRRLLQVAWLACGLGSTASLVFGAPPPFALTGGAAFAAAVALPVLVLRRSWDTLSLVAMGIAALQWALTLAWALG
ncbi:MAG: prenyltransferase [Candidatus Thermoplasmatota archaeon]